MVKDKCSKKSYGNYIIVQHKGFCSLYAHLSKVNVKVGDQVTRGMEIAKSGNSGHSTGPHLHFEIREGKYNPITFWNKTKGKFDNSVDPKIYLSDDWRINAGRNALTFLNVKGLVSDPELWTQTLMEPLPAWVVWAMLERVVSKK